MEWHTTKALRVLRGLQKAGWSIKRQKGSHRILHKTGCGDYTFAFHDREEIGPKMLSRIAKYTGLKPDNL